MPLDEVAKADDTRANTADFLAAITANQKLNTRGTLAPKAISQEVQAAVYGESGGSMFAPGSPIVPDAQRPVRYVDFNTGINYQRRPRSTEGFSFEHLKAFSNVELVRLAIETRKEQVEALNWTIQLKNPIKGEKGDNSPAALAIGKFFTRPDGEHDFSTWVRMLLEDLLVSDAPAIERQRTRNGKLASLLLVPGETINPLLDVTGRRPRGPGTVSYQQIIKGVIWADLTDEDLIYVPRNPRPGKIFGYSPVEQIIVTIQTILSRQSAQLGYFTDSNIPAGILTGPEGWTATQLKELQDAFELWLKGNAGHKNQLLWTPFGTKYTAFKESPLKDDFDEWLARVVMYAFNLPPTPFIKQMNRSTAANDSERGAEEGLMPIKLWLKRLFDNIIASDLNEPEYEFVWVDNTEVDADKQAKVDDLYLRNGSVTINEVRLRRGMPPVEGGDTLLIYSPSGVLPLETLLEAPNPQQDSTGGAQQDSGRPQPGSGGKTPAPTPKGPQPPKGKAGPKQQAQAADPARKLAKAAGALPPVSATRPKARRHAAEVRRAAERVLSRVGDEAAAALERRVRGFHKAITLDGVNTDPFDVLNEGDDDQAAETQAKQVSSLMDLSDLITLAALIQPALSDLFEDSATQAFASTGAELSDEIAAQFEAAAKQYASQRTGDLVSPDGDVSLVRSTRDMVARTVASGLKTGSSASDIADDVQTSRTFSADRAEDIGDTESVAANGAGVLAGYEAAQAALGIALKKVWITEDDDKVDDTCRENEAAGPIPLDEPFPSGDQATPAHNRCRCDVSVIV